MDRAGRILQRYQEVSRFSVQMRDAARQGRWDDLIALERARESQVAELKRDLGQGAVPPEVASQVGALIAAILEMDGETQELAVSWKGELKGLLESVNTERKLSQTYGP